MRVPKCRSVREVRTLPCAQIGGTENTHVHVVCLGARCGMIGLDMFICCLLKVHFLGPSRRRWGGLEGLAVDQLPQPLYMRHKY
ncbi:unnamed protein product [Rangifer tarandus platyrhynchus]|uniref:Uncharacterized protein n=1 Tax=Rangifer tarandus platyrhynchus TaxID=3082113 RepID=A0AC59YVP7_RANTA